MKKHENLLERITVNSKVMMGKPTIRNMRISVEQILKALGNGISEKALLKEYPELEKEDIQAAIQYAASVVAEEKVYKVEI